MERTQLKKKVACPAANFSLVPLTRLVCERFETSPLARFSFEYEDPASRERFVLSTDADFQDCLEESVAKQWSAIRLVVSEIFQPMPVSVVVSSSSSVRTRAGSIDHAAPPSLTLSPVLEDKKKRRKSSSRGEVEPTRSPSPSLEQQGSVEKGLKTIRRGGKVNPQGPRTADSLFEPSSTPASPTVSPQSSQERIFGFSPASSLVMMPAMSGSASGTPESSPMPRRSSSVLGKDSLGGSSESPRRALNASSNGVGIGGSGTGSLATTPRTPRTPRTSRGRSQSSVGAEENDLEGLSREALLLALKTGDDSRDVPAAVAAASGGKSKKLTTTIRRPKATEPVKTGRSLEDFAKILSADSSVHEPEEALLQRAKTSKQSRPASVLLRGVSTMSISTAGIPRMTRRIRSRLEHQASLQDMDRPTRSQSAISDKVASASAAIAQKSRSEVMEELRKQSIDLDRAFPKDDLQTFFKRKDQRFQRNLQRVKANKYMMVMPNISLSGLTELGKMLSAETRKSPLASPVSQSVEGLDSIVTNLVRVFVLSPEDSQAIESCRAVCSFAPRLPGGPAVLLSLVRSLYREKTNQSGCVVFVLLFRQVLARFGKALQRICEEFLDEFCKAMQPMHRQACLPPREGTSSQHNSPFVTRKANSGLAALSNVGRKLVSGRSLDLVELDMRALADALMVIDFENMTRMPLEDFLFQRWEAGKREVPGEVKGKVSHIFVCVKRWVHVGDWVASEIVCTAALKQRIVVVRKFVDLASELWMRGDFQSTMAVVSALQSAAVARLHLTWKGLSTTCMKKFELLSQLCGPQRHFGLYREELAKRLALRKSAPNSVILPFLGLVTQELTSLEESAPDFIEQKLNFEKICIMHKIVGRFFEMVGAETSHLPVVSPDVLSYAAKLTQTLSEEELYTKSLSIEGRSVVESAIPGPAYIDL